MFALAMGIVTANAQENVTVGTDNGSEQPTLTKEVYPQKEADGDLYHGLTKKLTFDRMVPPHGLEVTYDTGSPWWPPPRFPTSSAGWWARPWAAPGAISGW